tara:strand:- start:676 stop:1962 length:1287 start_codon:yes stop_codon:yes gene_type:complete
MMIDLVSRSNALGELKNFTFNFGPQHPAAHGVLRLVVEVEGETVVQIDPHIGLLHRATEKLMESKPFNHSIGYMDRLDYVSILPNEHVYVMAIEQLLGLKVPKRAQYIRVMFDEISRILNHLLVLGSTALDMGALTPWFYTFREREILMDCYEAVSGARMHANYYCPGGVLRDLPNRMAQFEESPWRFSSEIKDLNAPRSGSLLDYIQYFTDIFPARCDEYEALLTDNRIWKQRTVGISPIDADRALALGFTGPMLRSTGYMRDLRVDQPYAVYDALDFNIALGKTGDCYDRYLVRVAEMRESNRIIQQCVDWLRRHKGPVVSDHPKVVPPTRERSKMYMEEMIHQFKHFSEGYSVPEGETYAAVEHPKGEMGVYMVSDGANKPYRVKIRAAGFPHLQALNELCRGHMLSDVVVILASMDIVFGEIDR